MRKCADCGCLDEGRYEFLERCTCPANPARHGLLEHAPDCHRVRHLVIPRRILLRKYRETDGKPEINGTIELGKEHEYYTKKGWRGRVFGGKLYAEKLLCPNCFQKWEASQEQRRLYLERVAAMTKPETESYYQMLGRN